jgi:hypothetical protein
VALVFARLGVAEQQAQAHGRPALAAAMVELVVAPPALWHIRRTERRSAKAAPDNVF